MAKAVRDEATLSTVTPLDTPERVDEIARMLSGAVVTDEARAAARALIEETDLDAEAIARKAMKIAAEICVYTNSNFSIEKLDLND